MPHDMPALTPKLVSKYIESAQPFVESKTDQLIVELADKWNTPPKFQRRRNPHVEEPTQSKAVRQAHSVEDLIWVELHAALCKKAARYREEIHAIKNNVHLLIGAIAGYVAGKLGLAVAVVAALVAALLSIVLKMGVTVFCQKFESGFF
jgi:hypothetical protein